MHHCVIGITFLLASIYSTIYKPNKDIFSKFKNLLNDQQVNIYHSIVQERIQIYTIALVSGLIAASLYYYRYPKRPYKWCTFLVIAYIVKLGVYYFYPKSPLMLYSLTTKEQTDAWADIYTEMKYRYRISLFIGFIGYLIISSGLN
jgi:hypothetical protein